MISSDEEETMSKREPKRPRRKHRQSKERSSRESSRETSRDRAAPQTTSSRFLQFFEGKEDPKTPESSQQGSPESQRHPSETPFLPAPESRYTPAPVLNARYSHNYPAFPTRHSLQMLPGRSQPILQQAAPLLSRGYPPLGFNPRQSRPPYPRPQQFPSYPHPPVIPVIQSHPSGHNTMSQISTVAAQLIQKMNRANNQWISLSSLLSAIVKHLGVRSFERLNLVRYFAKEVLIVCRTSHLVLRFLDHKTVF